jgi:WD40 repeat protein
MMAFRFWGKELSYSKALRFVALLLCLIGLVNTAHSQSETPTQTRVYRVVWSPDGAMIAISGGALVCDDLDPSKFAIRIFDSSTGLISKTLVGHVCPTSDVDWSPHGERLVSISSDDKAYVWDVATGKIIASTPIGSHGMISTVWNPISDLIASAYGSNGIGIWDARSGEGVGPASLLGTTVDWSPDGTRVVTGSGYDNSVIISDATTGQHLLVLQGHTDVIGNVAWSPDGSKIASASNDNTIRIWDSTTGAELEIFSLENVNSIRWSPDGQSLAATSTDGRVVLWNVNIGYQFTEYISSDGLFSVGWSPDGTKLAYFERTSDTLQIVTPSFELPTQTAHRRR